MKKNLFNPLLIFICVCTLAISSCKKGEDDPSFTLLSRKARVAGTWKLQEGTINIGIKDSTGASSSYSYSLTSTVYHLNKIYNASNADGTSSLEISFTKKGEFTISQAMDSLTFSATGVWDFLGRGKGYKNKERLMITLNHVAGSSGYLNLFNMSLTPFDYEIKELRNKKMVLVATQEIVAANQGGLAQYVTSEYTFVQ